MCCPAFENRTRRVPARTLFCFLRHFLPIIQFMNLTEFDLIALGYPAGDAMKLLLACLADLESRGIHDPKYALKLLRREFGPPPPKLAMCDLTEPLAEALLATTPDEIANLHAVRRQMNALLRTPVISRGAIMPDACPAGSGEAVIPVGGVIAVENAIIPSAHSADICCSLFASFYESGGSVSAELDALMAVTRFGAGSRPPDQRVDDPVHDENVWTNPFLTGLRERTRFYMADQGDGNHFAFLGEMEITPDLTSALCLAGHTVLAEQLTPGKTFRVLVTHHGSRGLGAHVYKRGQIAALKHTAKEAAGVPEAAAWLDIRKDYGPAYWEALQYVSRWTKANHRAIHRRFLEKIGAVSQAEIGNEHNFVWQRGDTFLHGKGATPAWKDAEGRPLLGLIPLNMAEPVLLVLGADNPDFLSFAPHGAGRNLSRTALRRRYAGEATRLAEIQRSTRGIDVRWFCGKPDLSETPVAYKNAAQVREQIATFGLANVIGEIRPLGCIMAGDSGKSWRSREEELTPKQLRQIEHRAERRKVRQQMDDWEEGDG